MSLEIWNFFFFFNGGWGEELGNLAKYKIKCLDTFVE